MKNKITTRRNFLKKSVITTGVAAVSPIVLSASLLDGVSNINKLPREVWIAGISQMDLQTKTSYLMVDELIRIVKDVAIYQPDVICLPELFATSNVVERTKLSERKELTEMILQKFSGLAKQYSCYIICAVNTFEGDKTYNSAVVLDREGARFGEYHKIHLTEGEIKAGLTPGPIPPPVFQTDFGKIGIQICFDIEWDDSWTMLREQGAEIVFWSSAFAGGNMVNTKAWRHKYVVASSTRKNTSKICDITGETVTETGIWDKNFYCAPVNLEKAFLHTWPYVNSFGEIRKKYGRKVRITNFHEEEWSIIESLSPDVFVADIMKDFDMKTHEQHIHDAEIAQIKARKD
jgi:beta-ureidopropionase